jgi:hypothetical protein
MVNIGSFKLVFTIQILFLMLPVVLLAQDAEGYLDRVKAGYDQIKDYQADIQIKVDVDFIRMPVKNATMYFKQPDKVKFKSDEFIMLPKVGADFSLNKMLNTPHRTIFNGFDPERNNSVILQILPTDPKSGVILSTVWVDTLLSQVRKAEIFTRAQGNFNLSMTYRDKEILPGELVISFMIDPMNIPLNFIGKSVDVDEEMLKQSEQSTGTVTVTFINYRINTGLGDGDFDD